MTQHLTEVVEVPLCGGIDKRDVVFYEDPDLTRESLQDDPDEVRLVLETFTPGGMFDALAEKVRGITGDAYLEARGDGPTLRTSTVVRFSATPG